MTTNFPYGAAYFSSQIAYDSESSGAISQSVQSKLKQTVSVMDFGAVGDGVTDDTAATISNGQYSGSIILNI